MCRRPGFNRVFLLRHVAVLGMTTIRWITNSSWFLLQRSGGVV